MVTRGTPVLVARLTDGDEIPPLGTVRKGRNCVAVGTMSHLQFVVRRPVTMPAGTSQFAIDLTSSQHVGLNAILSDLQTKNAMAPAND